MTLPGDRESLMTVDGVTKRFGGGRDWRLRRRRTLTAVDDATLDVPTGQTLGIVGESGSGKSTLARIMVGLLAPTAGRVRLSGQPVHALKGREKARFHAQVQMIFQDPVSSLNPRKTVRQILEAPLIVLLGMAGPRRRERLSELMDLVALRAEFLDRYPHEFSGGQAQRIGIARALAAEPRLLIMDEPVSALDVSIQAQVIKLLRRLQGELGLTYVFISHDMAVIENLCDDVVVMRQGQIVERGARERLFRAPEHSYTRLLLRSVPVPGRRQALAEVAG